MSTTLPSDLSNYICTFHNPHKTNYDRVVRELILKNLDETQLLLVKLTKKSRYDPYFVTERDCETCKPTRKTVWLAHTDPFYDGSWGRILCSPDEFMEFFDIKVCYHWWKNEGGFWWNVEELREIFDNDFEDYLDHAMEIVNDF